MAACAVLAEAALVHVIGLMAGEAFLADVLVSSSQVALLARHGNVQADQRKVAQVVIESDVGAPALERVTLRAVGAELAGMNVARSMARVAFAGELLRGCRCRMTRVTGNFRMAALERVFGIPRVIEGRRGPLLV